MLLSFQTPAVGVKFTAQRLFIVNLCILFPVRVERRSREIVEIIQYYSPPNVKVVILVSELEHCSASCRPNH